MTSDLILRPSSASSATLDPPELAVEMNRLIGPQPVQSVHPWGFIVPGEVVAYGATVLVTIQAHWVPAGTTFVLRVVPDDGSTPYEARLLHVGPNPVEYFKLPNAWLADHVGRTVYLGYEAEWPDGTRANGPGYDVQITPLLEVSPVKFDGLEPGEPLDPAKFPDGLSATVEPIAQIRDYHHPALFFAVNGFKDGYLSTIILRGYSLEGLREGQVSVVIDPAAYTGHYEDGYTDVYVVVNLQVKLLPAPNPHGVEPFLLGRLDVLPPR